MPWNPALPISDTFKAASTQLDNTFFMSEQKIEWRFNVEKALGDVVSVHDESLPRNLWRTGVVHELIKRTDSKT